MTLTATVVNLVVDGADGNTGRTACGAGMTISAVRSQRHPVGMIGIAVFGSKSAMTGIALGASAFTHRNRNQGPCHAVAGAASAMHSGRSAYRHPTRQALGAGMASGTVS